MNVGYNLKVHVDKECDNHINEIVDLMKSNELPLNVYLTKNPNNATLEPLIQERIDYVENMAKKINIWLFLMKDMYITKFEEKK